MMMKSFFDSAWAGRQSTRQSTMGFVITVDDVLISSKSILQSIVALSSVKTAKYVTLSTIAKKLTRIRRVCWKTKTPAAFRACVLYPGNYCLQRRLSRAVNHQPRALQCQNKTQWGAVSPCGMIKVGWYYSFWPCVDYRPGVRHCDKAGSSPSDDSVETINRFLHRHRVRRLSWSKKNLNSDHVGYCANCMCEKNYWSVDWLWGPSRANLFQGDVVLNGVTWWGE